jgi:hypothetical protein
MRSLLQSSQAVVHSHLVLAILLVYGFGDMSPAVEFHHCFDVNPYRIVVPIDDQPGLPLAGLALLDTGAGLIAVDPICRSLLRGDAILKPVVTATGYTMLRFQTTAAFSIGGYPVPAGLNASAINLATYREAEGFNLMVVAGYPLLADKILDLDPEADVVRIFDHFPADIDMSNFSKFPITISPQGAIGISVRVDGFVMNIGLDTGSSDFLNLKVDDLLKLQKAGKLHGCNEENRAETMNGMMSMSAVYSTNFTIDHFRFANVKLSSSPTSNLGMQFLHNFRCIFDYHEKVLYLRPTPDYANFKPLAPVPFQLRMVHDGVTLVIEPGTPFYDLGLRSGFKLLAINENPVAQLGFFKAYELLRTYHQKSIALQIIDDTGQSRTITLPN